MNKKRAFLFSLVRNVCAIGIALLIAFVLIVLGTEGTSWGARIGEAVHSLRYMLISPLFKGNGSFSAKSFTDILASMIPIMFTGLATCVMFSAKQFNLGGEGGIMLGAFVTSMVAIYAPLPPILLPIVAILAGALATGLLLYIPAVLKALLLRKFLPMRRSSRYRLFPRQPVLCGIDLTLRHLTVRYGSTVLVRGGLPESVRLPLEIRRHFS